MMQLIRRAPQRGRAFIGRTGASHTETEFFKKIGNGKAEVPSDTRLLQRMGHPWFSDRTADVDHAGDALPKSNRRMGPKADLGPRKSERVATDPKVKLISLRPGPDPHPPGRLPPTNSVDRLGRHGAAGGVSARRRRRARAARRMCRRRGCGRSLACPCPRPSARGCASRPWP